MDTRLIFSISLAVALVLVLLLLAFVLWYFVSGDSATEDAADAADATDAASPTAPLSSAAAAAAAAAGPMPTRSCGSLPTLAAATSVPSTHTRLRDGTFARLQDHSAPNRLTGVGQGLRGDPRYDPPGPFGNPADRDQLPAHGSHAGGPSYGSGLATDRFFWDGRQLV